MKEARIIPLKCPNCQSSECTDLGNDKYKCNFCKTIFVYRKDVPQSVTNQTIFNTSTPTINSKNLLIGIGIFVGVIILIPLLGVLVGSRNSHSSRSAYEQREDRGSIQYAIPVTGKDKAYVWLYRTKRGTRDGESTYEAVIEVVDPSNSNVVKNISLAEPSRSDAIQFINGKCWALLENGVRVIDPITYETIETNESLAKRHQRLSRGLLACEFENAKDANPYLTVNTKDGNKYFYIPQIDSVLTSNELEENSIEMGEKLSNFPDKRGFFYFERVENSAKKEQLYKKGMLLPVFYKYFQRDGDVFTPDREYFFPKVLYTDKDKLVITYKNDADEENSPRIVQCISPTNGKVIWTCAENALQSFDPYWTRAAVAGSGSNAQILICTCLSYLGKNKVRAATIDMNNGKLLYTLKEKED